MSADSTTDKPIFLLITPPVSPSLATSLAKTVSAVLAKSSGFTISEWPSNETDTKPHGIPLLLCDNREALKQSGIMAPYEFIIERRDLLPEEPHRPTRLPNSDKEKEADNPVKKLAERLRMLADLYGKTDFRDALRDWFAGAFRMYLMLDSTTHGTSEFVDLELVKMKKEPILKALSGFSDYQEIEDAQNHAKILHDRFVSDNGPKDNGPKSELMKKLFPEYFEPWNDDNAPTVGEVGRSVVRALALATPQDRFEALCAIYCDEERKADGDRFLPREHAERLPVTFGDRAKYVTPSGKLNLLLIDDKVEESPFGHLDREEVPEQFSATISQDDWTLLRDIFNVQKLEIARNENVHEFATRRFRDFQKKGLTFDLILVDLCLGNNRRGDDLAGYAMIRIVKMFFPGTPVVVYSRFSDMEHIARAFSCGAKWFLVKGEEAKLPRHVLKLIKQVGWHREWRAIQQGANSPIWDGDGSSPFYQKFKRTPEWQYLTCKSLESLPGSFIAVKQMSEGLSSAATFKATKGVKIGGAFLQTPSIIKIDTSHNTMMEFERYYRMIRPYIANEAGRVEAPERVLNRAYSSIVYTFAGKQDRAHTLESMGDMLDDDVRCLSTCDYETYRHALTCIFDEILPKIHRVSPELELGDVGRPNVLPSDVKDAFEWESAYAKDGMTTGKTSFPNVYFREFMPSEFWKSYVIRMQPWYRITIDRATVSNGKKHLFLPQPTAETAETENKKKLTFHCAVTHPFSPGQRIIEAYTKDGQLVWLDGAVCDFTARFRKRISVGAALRSAVLDALVDNDGRIKPSESETGETGLKDWRIEWLKDVFSNRGKDEHAQDDFRTWVFSLTGRRAEDKAGLGFYTALQDDLIEIAKEAQDNAREWDMKCPIGIVHGDLNAKNIMLESRCHPPKEDAPDVTKTVSDVWLIDFARTRRDLIAHDFNVFFTSVLHELFAESLIGEEGKEKSERQKKYLEKLSEVFKAMVSSAAAPESGSESGIPDEIMGDRRFTLVYRILRRTHDAALGAGVSQNMFLLTSALTFLYTLKVFLNHGCKVRLAAGFFAAAWICYDLLCEAIGRKSKMPGYR